MTKHPQIPDDPELSSFIKALLLAIAAVTIAVGLVVAWHAAHAQGKPDYSDVPPAVREWFRGVRAPSGVPCCDIADGHRTTFETRGDEFWVPIEGVMTRVPPEVIVQHSRNPTGDAVVWWVKPVGYPIVIRCFVLPEMG